MTLPQPLLSLLYFSYLFLTTLASPVDQLPIHPNASSDHNAQDEFPSAIPNSNFSLANPENRSSSSGLMASWLWSLVWGDESMVAVVDRTPALTFNARPAAFGPSKDVLGYMIRVEDFSVPCDDEEGTEGGEKTHEPWWPGGGNESGWERLRLQKASKNSDVRHGCPKLCLKDKNKPEVTETWIALIMRGECTFVDKVREAQRFGAKGVVVGGENAEQDSHGDGLVQMYSMGDASDITIPSVYITYASYSHLSTLIASSNTSTWGLHTVSVAISIDPSGWEWYSYVLIPYILLFLPSSLTLCTLLIHRFRAARAARRDRAPEDIVHNLPWRVWEGQQTVIELEKELDKPEVQPPAPSAAPEGEEGPSTSRTGEVGASAVEGPLTAEQSHWYDTQGECAICLEDFTTGDKVRVLPCRHIFHMEEVDDWLIQRKKLCPICKHDVTLPLGVRSPQDDDDEENVGSSSLTSRNAPAATDIPSSFTHSPSSSPQSEPTERTPLLAPLPPSSRS